MEPEEKTIAEIAAGDTNFSILVTALDAAGLVGTLADPDADFTVFAPTNDAFATLAAELGYTGDPTDTDAVFAAIAGALAGLSEDGDPIPLLTDILLYHVSSGSQSADDIAAADSVATLNSAGAAITPSGGRLVDLEPDLLDPEIVAPDVAAANGTIQVIDRVLIPLNIPGNDLPTIAGIAAGNDDFEVLVLALEAANLTAVLDDPDDEFTVFAPTDAAFAALAQSFGFTGDVDDADAVFGAIAGALTGLADDGDPIPLLSDILLYHVSPGAQSVEELIAADEVATALGTPLIPAEGGIIDADPDVANAGFVDGLTELAASNGTVQVIDAVLLPLDLDNSAPTQTIAEIVAASGDAFDDDNGDFDMLLAALTAAGLVDAVADPDADFTVLAPTDAAFIALAQSLGSTATAEDAAFADIVSVLTELSGDGDPVPLLTDILLYHVIDGSFSRVELAEGPALTTLGTGAPVTDGDSVTDADPGLGDALFLDAASDIVATNGIVQAIDKVLLPIDVPEVNAAGSVGDDVIPVSDSTASVDGGAGSDTASFGEALAEATVSYTDTGFAVEIDGQTVALTSIETIEFSDDTVVADTGEASAAVARLYDAALDRRPDLEGATFWTDALETGTGTLDDLADLFIGSEEFAALYGPEPTHGEYVDALYGNVLDRDPDAEGRDFWTDVLATDGFDASDLLVFFSESPEFQQNTAELFDDGVLIIA